MGENNASSPINAPVAAPRRFVGSYSHSLDTKGRVVIPQPFREGLGNPFTIAPSQDFKAICLYADDEWEKVRARYDSYGNNSKVRRFLVFFDAFSFREQEFDNQGRILVPMRIRKQILGDEKDIEISGAGNAIRITTSSYFTDMLSDMLNDLPDIEEEIDRLDAKETN